VLGYLDLERNLMKSSLSDVSVVIVGAGPTGLTLACDMACDMARRNVDFRIIDKVPVYFAGSRGKGLQPRTLEIFDNLGIIDHILSCGRFHLPFRSYDGATILGDNDNASTGQSHPGISYASSLIIAQWRVEESLRQLLETYGVQVERQCCNFGK
jgi:2-polyprenyl-6-methoxyphenol hydroxylase-like FAD-dependent oxidoreductase